MELDRRFLGKTATERRHPSYQFSHRKRFRQVIIGAQGEPVHPIVQLTARRQNQDAAIDVRFTQAPQHFEAVDGGQHHVEDDETISRRARFTQRRLAIMRNSHVVPGIGQGTRDVPSQPNFIFYDQNAHIIEILFTAKNLRAATFTARFGRAMRKKLQACYVLFPAYSQGNR